MKNRCVSTEIQPFNFKLKLIQGDPDFIMDSLSDILDGDNDASEEDILSILERCSAFVTTYEILGEPIIYFVTQLEPIEDRVIVHEAYHIMNFAFKAAGYVHQIDNDEMDAYLLEHIFDLIQKFIKNAN